MNPVIFRPSYLLLPILGLSGLAMPTRIAHAQSVDATAQSADASPENGAKNGDAKPAEIANSDWKPLAGSWVVSQFGGDGPVDIKENQILLGIGDPLTGVRWKGDVLREDFEIELEARRIEGFDFFCGLTFPVGESHVSLILGGWGGGVVGISSIDGRDASENETTSFRSFDNDQWYKVRVRVDSHEIRAWIDDKEACAHPRKDHKFGIRYEMDQCVPLGVAAFQTKSELRGIKFRKLTDDEIAQAKQKSESAD